MKTLKSKIIALAVCSALTASAFAAAFNSSDDATKATLNISITAIKPHVDKTSGSSNTAPPKIKQELVEWVTVAKSASIACTKSVREKGKIVCREYQTNWYDHRKQVLATYENGKKVKEQVLQSTRCYIVGTRSGTKYIKSLPKEARQLGYAPSDYRKIIPCK